MVTSLLPLKTKDSRGDPGTKKVRVRRPRPSSDTVPASPRQARPSKTRTCAMARPPACFRWHLTRAPRSAGAQIQGHHHRGAHRTLGDLSPRPGRPPGGPCPGNTRAASALRRRPRSQAPLHTPLGSSNAPLVKDGRIARASERYACAPRHRRRTLARAGGAHARAVRGVRLRGASGRAPAPLRPRGL